MKKQSAITFLVVLFVASHAIAQAPFTTNDSVDINRINASVMVHGDMWWDPVTLKAKCEFPKGSGRNIGFASGLWMSGYDAGNNIHVAAQSYRQTGNDFWPGPLDASDTLTYATSQKWAKIWKVNRNDIQSFRALSTHTTTNTPPTILTWPATGNAYAAGNGGTVLTITAGTNMAPFIDLNGNGVYEPLSGDYPDIKGDQALWYIFSDNGPAHNESNAKPIGVEVHAMAYAYSRNTLIDNVIYYEYSIINRSANIYHDFRFAQYADIDLGYYRDDFLGFDSVHRMGIIYNGISNDGSSAGFPVNSYGVSIPIVGVSMVALPGDAGSSYVPTGSFTFLPPGTSSTVFPSHDTGFNNLMHAKTATGVPFMSYFPGYGAVRYPYPGDPSDTGSWSECAAGNTPGDRRFVISSNDFTLAPGQTKKIVLALVTTDTGQGGCPNVSFHDIKTVADTAWNIYYHPLPPLGIEAGAVATNGDLKVYPNPAHDRLFSRPSKSAQIEYWQGLIVGVS